MILLINLLKNYFKYHLNNFNYLIDQELLRRTFMNAYNRFKRLYPIEKESYVCRSGRLKSDIKKRRSASFNNFANHYSNLRFLKFYCKLRNIEEGKPHDAHQMKKMESTIRDLQKIFDTSRALGYINEEYRKLIKTKEGSLEYYKQRQAEKKMESEGSMQQQTRENQPSSFVGGPAEGGTTGGSGGATGGSGGSMGGGGGY